MKKEKKMQLLPMLLLPIGREENAATADIHYANLERKYN